MPRFAFTAQAATPAPQDRPSQFPSWWPYPPTNGDDGPWPPGWPLPRNGLEVVVNVLPACFEIIDGGSKQDVIEAKVQLAGLDTDTLKYHLMRVRANVAGSTRQIKEVAGAFADELFFTITNYTGIKWGFLKTLIANLIDADFNQNLTWQVDIVSVDPVVGPDTDNVIVSGCCKSHCIACPACSGANDISIVIPAVVPASGPLTGSRTVRSCAGTCNSCGGKVDSAARVRVNIANPVCPRCVFLTFSADFSIPIGNSMGERVNCGTEGFLSSSGTGLVWFLACVAVGATVNFCVDHRLSAGCGGTPATITNWSVLAVCTTGGACVPPLGGCPACP